MNDDVQTVKFVAVKMENGKYLFTVPKDVMLKAGDNVLVKTIRGEQTGVCACDAFWSEEPETVCRLWGTQMDRMQPVVGIYRVERF